MRFSLPRQDVRHVNYHQVFQKMQIIWQQMVTLNPPPGVCITAGLEHLQSSSSVQPILDHYLEEQHVRSVRVRS